MKYRIADSNDCPMLAAWNHQLIQDEGHRNPMTIAQLEQRMREWLGSGEYQAILFDEHDETVAYALFRETEKEIYLRQFFVVTHRRREGIGRRAINQLFTECWPKNKRWTVDVLAQNQTAISFWRAMGYTDYALTLELMPTKD